MNPTHFMVGLAVMANLEGTATLVGDPPSMIFADYVQKIADQMGGKFGFNEFFFFQGKPSIFFAVQVGMIVGALFFYGYFARKGGVKVQIEKEKVLTPVPSVLLILMILGLATMSFVYGGVSLASGLLVMILALGGLLWYRFIRRESREKVFELIKGLL
ncbi:hypothetical protein AGMMS49546_33440 [Spirochaetia bacterium]|nr:hypothetical protein AGMMS49546_33440 [Spirochaetia bacterium]